MIAQASVPAAGALDRVGARALDGLRQLGEISILLSETAAATGAFLREARRVGDPAVRRRLSATFRDLVAQMLEFGLRSVPVAAITSATTGMVFTLETGRQMMDKLGSPLFVGGLSGVGIVRELGPVLSALMVAARMGSSITAEIGTMKVTEQIDALKTLGESPVRYLVLPRFLAAVLMMPLLAILADAIGVLGGLFVAVTQLDLTPAAFWDEFQRRVWVSDILHGLYKTVVFGGIVSIVACHKGFTAEGGAEGVGRACTESVVVSCMGILVADYLLTLVLP